MASSRGVSVVGVPSSLGAHAPGQEKAPAAFRAAGLLDLLSGAGSGVRDLGDLTVRRWTPDREHPRAQHAAQVADVAGRLADVVATEVTENRNDEQPNLVLVRRTRPGPRRRRSRRWATSSGSSCTSIST